MMITQLYLSFSLVATAYFNDFNPNIYPKSDYISVTKIQQSPLQKSIADGKEIYADFCMQCHLATGKGDGVNFPPLDGSDWLKKKNNDIIHVIKYGQSGEIVVNNKKYNNTMPPSVGLSDQEIADVMNYIMNSWSNKQTKMVTSREVEAVVK